jgi:hypothetical protein
VRDGEGAAQPDEDRQKLLGQPAGMEEVELIGAAGIAGRTPTAERPALLATFECSCGNTRWRE